jgi:hypothetical protein
MRLDSPTEHPKRTARLPFATTTGKDGYSILAPSSGSMSVTKLATHRVTTAHRGSAPSFLTGTDVRLSRCKAGAGYWWHNAQRVVQVENAMTNRIACVFWLATTVSATAAQPFDGNWLVNVATQVGNCGTYSSELLISEAA